MMNKKLEVKDLRISFRTANGKNLNCFFRNIKSYIDFFLFCATFIHGLPPGCFLSFELVKDCD